MQYFQPPKGPGFSAAVKEFQKAKKDQPKVSAKVRRQGALIMALLTGEVDRAIAQRRPSLLETDMQERTAKLKAGVPSFTTRPGSVQ